MDELTALKLRVNILTEIVRKVCFTELNKRDFKELKKLLPVCDAVIKCDDGELPVCKSILCARSATFNDLFEALGDFMTSDGTIAISGYRCHEVQVLTNYIMYGRTPYPCDTLDWLVETNNIIELGYKYDQNRLARILIEHRANAYFGKTLWSFVNKYSDIIVIKGQTDENYIYKTRGMHNMDMRHDDGVDDGNGRLLYTITFLCYDRTRKKYLSYYYERQPSIVTNPNSSPQVYIMASQEAIFGNEY